MDLLFTAVHKIKYPVQKLLILILNKAYLYLKKTVFI